MPPVRRIGFAAAVAMSLGLCIVVIGQGFSTSFPLRLLEALAIAVAATAAFAGLVVGVSTHLADWREPEGEAEFEKVVMRSERLAAEGLAAEPDEGEFLE